MVKLSVFFEVSLSHGKNSKELHTNQEMTWIPIDKYFAEKAPADAKKKYRNTAQKKKFIQEVLKMPLQFDRGCEIFQNSSEEGVVFGFVGCRL